MVIYGQRLVNHIVGRIGKSIVTHSHYLKVQAGSEEWEYLLTLAFF